MTSDRRNILFGFTLLAGVLVALVWWPHLHSKLAVQRYRRQLLAAGEKLKIEDLWPTPVPTDKNGASLFRQTMWNPVTDLLSTNLPTAMRLVAPAKAIVGWAQPDVRDHGTNSWAEVQSTLADYADTLDILREAAQRPALDFALDYRMGPSLLLPHLAPLKRGVLRLSAAALNDLHHGDAAAAGTNLHAMIALVNALSDEPLAISQLVRLACAHICLPATWEFLQSPNATADQLAALQRDWTKLRLLEPAKRSLEFERAFDQMTLERMRNSSGHFRQLVSPGNAATSTLSLGQIGDDLLREIVLRTREARWRLSLSYPDQLRSLKGFQVLIDSGRLACSGQPFLAALQRQKTLLSKMGLQSTNDNLFLFDPSGDLSSVFSQSVTALGRVLHRVFAAEVARELAVAALALKRYELAHGQYPAALAALVPNFLPSLPRDPADHEPLRYHLLPDATFLLYSIGEDGIDDGGNPSPSGTSQFVAWFTGRDLVWPSPATPAEISAFQQKNP